MHSYGWPASSQRVLMCVAPRQETAFTFAEKIVQHIAPVAEHVDDDAAAIFLAVVPGRPLRGNRVALEHPVAELAAHREDLAEEAQIAQRLELQHAGQPELVLHHAVLHAGFLRELRKDRARLRGRRRSASRNRCACPRRWPSSRHRRGGRWSARRNRSEYVGIRQRVIEIGGPVQSAAFLARSPPALRRCGPTSIGSGMIDFARR